MEWSKRAIVHELTVASDGMHYDATLTHRLGSTDFPAPWEWHLHASAETLRLFAGALGYCRTKGDAMEALEAEAGRVFELVERMHEASEVSAGE